MRPIYVLTLSALLECSGVVWGETKESHPKTAELLDAFKQLHAQWVDAPDQIGPYLQKSVALRRKLADCRDRFGQLAESISPKLMPGVQLGSPVEPKPVGANPASPPGSPDPPRPTAGQTGPGHGRPDPTLMKQRSEWQRLHQWDAIAKKAERQLMAVDELVADSKSEREKVEKQFAELIRLLETLDEQVRKSNPDSK
jgi:hypothetical protein